MFNLAYDLIPNKENVMPERLALPHKGGGATGQMPLWRDILDKYWQAKNWPNGIPSGEQIAELGLASLKSQVWGINPIVPRI